MSTSLFNHPFQQIFGFFDIAVPIGFKVCMAIICGGLIGIERELKHKPAGIKTNILICLGSTLYTVVSILTAQSFVNQNGQFGDPSRIAAQIVSGIGFIGAGAIMQSKVTVTGVTTAATIWIVAAIGLCIGSGYSIVAFVFTMTVLFTLLAIDKLEARFLKKAGAHLIEIMYEDPTGKIRAEINDIMEKNEVVMDDFEIIQKENNKYILRIQFMSSHAGQRKLVACLWKVNGIKEVKQI